VKCEATTRTEAAFFAAGLRGLAVFAFVLVVAGAAAVFLAAGAAAFLVVVEAFFFGSGLEPVNVSLRKSYLGGLLLLGGFGGRLLLDSRLLVGLLGLCWGRRGLGGAILLRNLHRARRSFGAEEVTGLLTTCEGEIKVLDECRVGGSPEVLVGLDVFLDGLTAVRGSVSIPIWKTTTQVGIIIN